MCPLFLNSLIKYARPIREECHERILTRLDMYNIAGVRGRHSNRRTLGSRWPLCFMKPNSKINCLGNGTQMEEWHEKIYCRLMTRGKNLNALAKVGLCGRAHQKRQEVRRNGGRCTWGQTAMFRPSRPSRISSTGTAQSW